MKMILSVILMVKVGFKNNEIFEMQISMDHFSNNKMFNFTIKNNDEEKINNIFFRKS